jgi:hypothetical protein
MSLESVRADLANRAPDLPIIEVEASTATVNEAAEALGVEPARIAKTLAVRAGEVFLLVTRGDARLDNLKTRRGSAPVRACWAGGDAGADRPSGRRRLPIRPCNAAARLLRRVAPGVQHRLSCRRIPQQLGRG